MALNVTLGSRTAESLCTVAEADAYLAATATIDSTAWDDMEDAEKENLLRMAAMAMCTMRWLGWQCYEEQAMPWPRWLGTEEEYTAATAQMPVNVKKAQAILAYDVIWRGLQGRASPDKGVATADAIKSISLFGDVSLSFGNQLLIPLRDGFTLQAFVSSRHIELWLLLSPYVTEFSWICRDYDDDPDLLDAVA